MWRAFVAAVLLINWNVCAADEVTHPYRSLSSTEGYLLLDLSLERGVSEIFLRVIPQPTSGFRIRDPKDITLGPYEEGRHLILAPMIEGRYRWASTAVPHFDLPFRLDTSDDERWRFTITRARINYVGQLVVRKERSTDAISLDLLNRIATTQEMLSETFGGELKNNPIRYAGYLRDQFFEVHYPESKESSK